MLGVSNSGAEDDFRTSFRVSTGGKDYFLKRVGDWIAESRLSEIEGFIRWTEARNYMLSPALKVTTAGQTHIAVGENRFQLFDFLEQEKRQIWMRSHLSQEDCTLAGDLLARMHLASADYLRENTDKRTFLSIPFECQASCEALFQRIQSGSAVSYPVLLSVAKNEDHLKARLDNALRMVSLTEKSATPLLVHGDFHPGNVLFFKNEVGASAGSLVDFDYLRRGHPLFDLGYALLMFARSQPLMESNSSEQTSDHGLDWQLGKAILRGYVQALHKNPAEKDELKIRKAELMASFLVPRLQYYVTIACFLILDWAVEKLINGPGPFSDVYADVIEMIDSFCCSDLDQVVESIWIEALTETPF
ncbi:MAG: phosphotransferase [Candidatus Melainabacteria bacterium]|nr:phosphotransferase [Candidatus Melainabacteria bacterium]